MTPANVEDIKFSSKSPGTALRKSQDVNPPTELELEEFYQTLNSSKVKPAILKITPPYSKEFIPQSHNKTLPLPISQLYDPETLQLDYLSQLKKFEVVVKEFQAWTTCVHINVLHY